MRLDDPISMAVFNGLSRLTVKLMKFCNKLHENKEDLTKNQLSMTVVTDNASKYDED